MFKLTCTVFSGMANQAAELEMGNTMVTASDNLANAAVQKNDTIERFVISNKALTDSLAARGADITHPINIITTLSTC